MGAVRFDAFTLDLEPPRLMQRDRVIPLRPQTLKVLAYLAERPGRTVSNDELIEGCWEEAKRRQTHANSVAQCIKEIRDALGEGERPIIRTVPRQGYALVAPVSAVTPALPKPQPSPTPKTSKLQGKFAGKGRDLGSRPLLGRWRLLLQTREAVAAFVLAILLAAGGALWLWPGRVTMMAAPSLAVLSVDAVGDDAGGRNIAGALSREIETALSRSPRGYDMRIKSASGYKASAAEPGATSRKLGVRYLVLGNTRRDGEARQVNIELVNGETGEAVWAETFAYAPSEAGAQTVIAARIARTLRTQVLLIESRLPLPLWPEAGHYVILGRAVMVGERAGVAGHAQAKALFDKARALDPDSLPALLGYGRIRVNYVLSGWADQKQRKVLLEEAGVAIRRALEVDSRDPGLHVLRGAFLRAQGKDGEAIASFTQAKHLLPTYPLAHAELGRAKIELGLAHEAVAHIAEAIRLSPKDAYLGIWSYWAGMAEAHVAAGAADDKVERYRKAIRWFEQALTRIPGYQNILPWLAVAHAGAGDTARARGYLDETLKRNPRFSISGWGRALAWRHPETKRQREAIARLLCEIGAPGCEAATSSSP
jgi:DNA-binding winged helix-turn-helix (wHTH) protein/TolB-like protein/cytochrome c-type biogenesis protein CcmH/NrfG